MDLHAVIWRNEHLRIKIHIMIFLILQITGKAPRMISLQIATPIQGLNYCALYKLHYLNHFYYIVLFLYFWFFTIFCEIFLCCVRRLRNKQISLWLEWFSVTTHPLHFRRILYYAAISIEIIADKYTGIPSTNLNSHQTILKIFFSFVCTVYMGWGEESYTPRNTVRMLHQ